MPLKLPRNAIFHYLLPFAGGLALFVSLALTFWNFHRTNDGFNPNLIPPTPTAAAVAATDVKQLISAHDLTAIQAYVDASAGNGIRRLELAREAIRYGNAQILRIALHDIEKELDNIQRIQLSTLTQELLYSQSYDKIKVMLEEVSTHDPKHLESRLVDAAFRDVKFADELFKARQGELSNGTWTTLLVRCNSPDQWSHWLPRFQKAEPSTRSSVLNAVLPTLLQHANVKNATELPPWSPLLAESDNSVRYDLAIQAIHYKSRLYWEEICRHGLPDRFYEPVNLAQIRSWDVELWRATLAKGPPHVLTAAWWGDVRSKSGTIQRLNEWRELLPLAIETEEPNRTPSCTAAKYAIDAKRWPVAWWLIEHAAKMPENSQSTVGNLFLAIVRGDTQTAVQLIKAKPGDYESLTVPGTGGEPGFDPLAVAIKIRNRELCEALLPKQITSNISPLVQVAISHQSWECLNCLLSRGGVLSADEIATINRDFPAQADLLFAHEQANGRQSFDSALPTLLLEAVRKKDLQGVETLLTQLRTAGRKLRDSGTPVTLEQLFKTVQPGTTPVTPTSIVNVSISTPAILSRLQTEGFPITKAHLQKCIEDRNQDSLAICLRSVLTMDLADDEMRKFLSEAGKATPSP